MKVLKCPACPLLFYVPRNKYERKYCSRDCANRAVHQENDLLVRELQWIAGTDSWDKIAHRLGFNSRTSLSKRLERIGEKQWAAKVGRVDGGHAQQRAA